jgi:hypothetical protein
MVDFCKQCSIKVFGKDFGDLANLCKENEYTEVLCENCGFILVDHTGERLDPDKKEV